ncbi:MAG: hypothetical protein KBC84_04850 [Proteobacteria bacterium]|nr:hypothetical protein [Pseudomonadota bacterium]
MKSHLKSREIFFLLTVILLAGCQDSNLGERWWSKLPGYGGYWWQRGQPKSVEILHQEATTKFAQTVVEYQTDRAEIAQTTQEIEKHYQNILIGLKEKKDSSALQKEVADAMQAMMGLEGKLSVGSRAAYGELAGQLRIFAMKIKSGEDFSVDAFGLHTARTLNFLSSELSMPKPVIL